MSQPVRRSASSSLLPVEVTRDLDELRELLRVSDPHALAQVYTEHHEAVRAFAIKYVGEVEAAEDLVHDTFVALPKAIKRFRGDSALRTFLISVAINCARHHVRAAARRRRAMDRLSFEPEGTSPETDEMAKRKELAAALNRALDTLPLKLRTAFVLCEVEGLSSVEAAEVIGVPEATVRTRNFHARRKLREALEQEGFA